jgi:RimJ/RimL family protein N-acetyltransferase
MSTSRAYEATPPPPERIIIASEADTVCLKQLIPDDDVHYFGLIAFDPDHLRQHGDVTARNYPDVSAVRWSIAHPLNPNRYRFGIWDGDVMVGSDSLTLRSEVSGALGSWVGKQHIGHDYAARARSLLISFAFDRLHLDEVYSEITVGNEPSRRSVEKSGLRYESEFTDVDGKQTWRYVLRRPGVSDPTSE